MQNQKDVPRHLMKPDPQAALHLGAFDNPFLFRWWGKLRKRLPPCASRSHRVLTAKEATLRVQLGQACTAQNPNSNYLYLLRLV